MKDSTNQDVRQCLLCQSALSGRRAKEHIVPKWLNTHLTVTDQSKRPAKFIITGSDSIPQRVGPNAFVAGRVCVSCNNGWMNDLEIEMQRIMPNLMNNRRSISNLTEAEQLALARWATKTAYMMDYGWKSSENVPIEHLHDLYQNQNCLPTGIAVFAQQHPTDFNQRGSWGIFRDYMDLGINREMDRTYNIFSNSYKIGVQFGSLFLLVAYWPTDGWTFHSQKDIHIPIWSASATLYAPDESAKVAWAKSQNPLKTFMDTLLVAENQTLEFHQHLMNEGIAPPLIPGSYSHEAHDIFTRHLINAAHEKHRLQESASETQEESGEDVIYDIGHEASQVCAVRMLRKDWVLAMQVLKSCVWGNAQKWIDSKPERKMQLMEVQCLNELDDFVNVGFHDNVVTKWMCYFNHSE